MSPQIYELYFNNSDEWRKWLEDNHDKSDGVWLVFSKKETGKSSIKYNEAVEEALCFGWIDSVIKKIDSEKYVRKFTPRKDNSNWSESNKNRIEKLIRNSRITKIGLAKVEAAKRNGLWDKTDRPVIQFDISGEFQAALDQNINAGKNFNKLAPSYQRQFIGWINIARQNETKIRRINESIALLEKNQKLGLK